MISFDDFAIQDGIPIYLQIVRHIKSGIVAKVIVDQDEMPSRRMLSALLGVNPNTIQKAYKCLEDEEIIKSKSGAKSYITLDDKQVRKIKEQVLEVQCEFFISGVKAAGVEMDQALELIKKLW